MKVLDRFETIWKPLGLKQTQIPGSSPGTLNENLKLFDPMDFIEGI